MNYADAMRLAQANVEVVILLTAAWAVSAWMMFRVSEYFAKDDLGVVDTQPRLKDWIDEEARRVR